METAQMNIDQRQNDCKPVEGQLMLISEIAQITGVPRTTIYRWHKRGVLLFHNVGGRGHLILEEFGEWLAKWTGRPRRTGRYMQREIAAKLETFLRHGADGKGEE
jgi:excisionase family DNA binding protein